MSQGNWVLSNVIRVRGNLVRRIRWRVLALWTSGLWLSLSIAFLSTFANESELRKNNTIRVIGYNVQFLPDPASSMNKRINPSYRARRIAEEVSRFDIIGLQETFHDTYREQIQQHVKDAWNGKLHFVKAPTPDSFYTSGGCLILSRLLILNSSSTVYTHFSKPNDYGLRADGFAAKGVIHARIVGNASARNEYVDVFVTHLEARAGHLRPLQYGELSAFVKEKSDPRYPVLILGDLNTRGATQFQNDPQSQYSSLVEHLSKARPGDDLIDIWPHLKGQALGGTTEQESQKFGRHIDYIFVINPQGSYVKLKPISVDVHLFQDPEVVALSDHNAVAAELEWVQLR